VGQRPRTVIGRNRLNIDNRSISLKPNLDTFFKGVEQGADLTPYLSLKAISQGYSPDAYINGPNVDKWSDKDFILNVMGLHHFHLGLNKESRGHMNRTNEVLFAYVTRDEFEVLGLFNHEVFEHKDDNIMTAERERLWGIYTERNFQNIPPAQSGQSFIGGLAGPGITLGGQPLLIVSAAQRHMRIMMEYDHKLDDRCFVETLYQPHSQPDRTKFKWCYNHLDFGIFEARQKQFFVIERGPT